MADEITVGLPIELISDTDDNSELHVDDNLM